jgi:hypothetical protein
MIRAAVLALALLLPFAAPAAADDEKTVFPVLPEASRFSLTFAQGWSFLDGGYADAVSYYSHYWDPGVGWTLRAALDLSPCFRAGLSASVREFEDRGFGIDDLHTGHARITGAFRLPFSLPARFLLRADALASLEGPIAFLRLEAGVGVIDPTSDAFGGFYDRTFTWSFAVAAGLEYRLERIGFALELGADMIGPPRPSSTFRADPDPILSFPLALSLSLYLP